MASLGEKNSDSILLSEESFPDCGMSGLNKAFDSAEWKTQVSISLSDLERRIDALETKIHFPINLMQRSSENNGDLGRVDSFTATGRYGLSGIPTCIRLVLTTRVASLQCFWLLLCIVSYVSIGIFQFIRAHSNEVSTWKPEKIDFIRDYVSGDVTEQYEMPDVNVFFSVSPKNESTNWTTEMIDRTFSDMLESQDFNSTAGISYLTPELDFIDDSLYCENVVIIFQGKKEDNSINGYFKITLSNPDPALGSFYFRILFDTDALTLNNTINVGGFWLSVDRHNSKLSLGNLAYTPAYEESDTTVIHVVDYTESVHYRYKNSTPTYYFETSAAWEQGPDPEYILDHAGVWIFLRGSLLVEYWREYVGFSYYDWFAAMGGLLSICTVGFFFVAHHIAKKLSVGHSIGILPELSVGFRNLEMLSWLRTQLEMRNILVPKVSSTQERLFRSASKVNLAE